MRSELIKLSILVFFAAYLMSASCALCKINGSIEQKGDEGISIKIAISKPAPATAIVTMDVPDGVRISSAKPEFSRIVRKKNQAQWLLKDLKPGNLQIDVKFDKKVDAEGLRVLVRYKDDSSGSMVEQQVQ